MHLPDGLDYVMRPVDAGYCKYESLLDGTLTLYDIAVMNDALDVRMENEERMRAWMKAHGDR